MIPETRNVTPAEFYDNLRTFVRTECRAQRDGFEQRLKKPLEKRISEGSCVTGLTFVGMHKDCYRFKCEENQADFREDAKVRIHRGDPFHPDGELVWAGDGCLDKRFEYIDLRVPLGGPPLEISGTVTYTLDESFLDMESHQMRAIEELGATERGRDCILPLLMGSAEDDQVEMDEYADAESVAAEHGFNDSQQQAIAEGVSANWCTLIQGPPGTGKTRVLANIVKQRVAKGDRVLVSACTHRAIHQALNSVAKAMPEFDRIAKIGQPINDPSLPVAQYETFADVPFKEESGAYVIGATPFGCRSKRLKDVEFDCLVVDEASQMTLPLAVMAMLSANVYIIIGDPKQLPPVVQSSSSWEAPGLSIFQHLERCRERSMLEVTYRMNGAITEWVSRNFYLGRLSAAEGCSDRRLQIHGKASQPWLDTALNPEHSLVWIRTNEPNTRHYSMEEAARAKDLVVELIRRGHSADEIGIVAPFRRQARLIRRRLRQTDDIPDDFSARILSDTVERMQGQERELIIISTAVSDSRFIGAIKEFLYLPARLNVAVSRARSKVIVMASDPFVGAQTDSPELRDAIEQWADLMNSACVIEL